MMEESSSQSAETDSGDIARENQLKREQFGLQLSNARRLTMESERTVDILESILNANSIIYSRSKSSREIGRQNSAKVGCTIDLEADYSDLSEN